MALINGVSKAAEVFRIFRFPKFCFKFSFYTLTERNVQNAVLTVPFNVLHSNYYSSNKKTKVTEKLSNPFAPEEPKKRKPLTSPQIMLILPDDKVALSTLEDAEKLSKRRDLKLTKILDFDTKSEKPLYKLLTNKAYLEESRNAKENKRKNKKDSLLKDLKIFTVSTKISEHDMNVKLVQIIKLLKKKHPVRIIILKEGNQTKADEMVKTIQEDLAEISIEKEVTLKGAHIKLGFNPKIEEETINENVSNDEKNENLNTENQKN